MRAKLQPGVLKMKRRYIALDGSGPRRNSYNCQCIPYGQLDPRKLDRLKKSRQKKPVAFKELLPFAEEKPTKPAAPAAQPAGSNRASRLFLPPILTNKQAAVTKKDQADAEGFGASQTGQSCASQPGHDDEGRTRGSVGRCPPLLLHEVESCLAGISPRDILDHPPP